ncbi:MAG TPA: hypothetical protein VF331_15625 [Polyangiales bacterium]
MGTSPLAASLLGGRYQLKGNLGAGGTGRVYDAYDLRLGRRVAVKVLTGAGNQDAGLCERLFREAKAAARANHPAVITVFGFGNDAAEFVLRIAALAEGSSCRVGQ